MNGLGKLVSIIIPAYNVENYIDECLDSLLSQTYSNLEIIVVDDGSKDGTWQHIQSYMDKDDRVKGFHRENSGVSPTRNFALGQMKGDYLMFVDSDDSLEPEGVEVMVNALESSDATWVNCHYNRVEDGKILEPYNFTTGLKDTSTEDSRYKLIMGELMDYLIGYEVWNKLFLTSIIKENNITFIEDCHIGEDLAFNIVYGSYSKAINCIEDRIYNYRIRTDSAMGNLNSLSKNFKEHLALVKGLQPAFEAAYKEDPQKKFVHLFYKLMLHASQGYTVKETVDVAKEFKDEYYLKYLGLALKDKSEFLKFDGSYKADNNYRAGLYVLCQLGGDIKSKIYLAVYDSYRKLRGRTTIGDWKML